MKIIAGYLNILVGLMLSSGIAVMASLATFSIIYSKNSNNKKAAVKEALKDGFFTFTAVFLCSLIIVAFIQKMF